MDLKAAMQEAYQIAGQGIALLTDKYAYVCPEDGAFDITPEEARSNQGGCLRGYHIYSLAPFFNEHYVCIQAADPEKPEIISLILLSIKIALESSKAPEAYIAKILDGKTTGMELAALEGGYGRLASGYVILVDGFGGLKDEIVEILVNSMEVRLYCEYMGRIVAVVEAEDIAQACRSFIDNTTAELLVECIVAVGGRSGRPERIKTMYGNCIEAIRLKQIYRLPECVLDYERMYSYRLACSLDGGLKEELCEKVFTREFTDILNNEMSTTIEEFFRSNLNLTDTANKLYIHRNTLLYRLDKIFKCTGFDLRKFEDSWLFRLAWLAGKEKGRI